MTTAAGQLLGKDIVLHTWVGSNGDLLHRTTAGFQFGSGRERKIVTSVEEVESFGEEAQGMVRRWLEGNGVSQAQKHLMDRDVAEQASEAPGTLDAMAKKLGPEVTAQLFQLLQSALDSKIEGTPPSPSTASTTIDENGIVHRLPDPTLVEHPKVVPTAGGVLLDKGNGHKEFVPGDEFEKDLDEEQALIAKQASGKKKRK